MLTSYLPWDVPKQSNSRSRQNGQASSPEEAAALQAYWEQYFTIAGRFLAEMPPALNLPSWHFPSGALRLPVHERDEYMAQGVRVPRVEPKEIDNLALEDGEADAEDATALRPTSVDLVFGPEAFRRLRVSGADLSRVHTLIVGPFEDDLVLTAEEFPSLRALRVRVLGPQAITSLPYTRERLPPLCKVFVQEERVDLTSLGDVRVELEPQFSTRVFDLDFGPHA